MTGHDGAALIPAKFRHGQDDFDVCFRAVVVLGLVEVEVGLRSLFFGGYQQGPGTGQHAHDASNWRFVQPLQLYVHRLAGAIEKRLPTRFPLETAYGRTIASHHSLSST